MPVKVEWAATSLKTTADQELAGKNLTDVEVLRASRKWSMYSSTIMPTGSFATAGGPKRFSAALTSDTVTPSC